MILRSQRLVLVGQDASFAPAWEWLVSRHGTGISRTGASPPAVRAKCRCAPQHICDISTLLAAGALRKWRSTAIRGAIMRTKTGETVRSITGQDADLKRG